MSPLAICTSVNSVNVLHNLYNYPLVQVLDSTGNQLIPLSVLHSSINDFTVSFNQLTTGTIIAQVGRGLPTQSFSNVISSSVTHNFGRYPLVQVINDLGYQFIPLTVIHNSLNDVTVTFATASSGTILISM